MDTKKQKAIASALRALADAVESDESPAEPAAKPAAARKPAAAAAAPSPADVANRASAAAGAGGAPTGTGDIMAQCRSAAKSYAEVYGREGLKEVLGKYTQGTLADVPADKLPDLLKELS